MLIHHHPVPPNPAWWDYAIFVVIFLHGIVFLVAKQLGLIKTDQEMREEKNGHDYRNSTVARDSGSGRALAPTPAEEKEKNIQPFRVSKV